MSRLPGKKEFVMSCGGCGGRVVVSAKRYRQLVESKDLPLCRVNGCYRYLTTRRRPWNKEIPIPSSPSTNLKRRAKTLKQSRVVYRPTKIMEGEIDARDNSDE